MLAIQSTPSRNTLVVCSLLVAALLAVPAFTGYPRGALRTVGMTAIATLQSFGYRRVVADKIRRPKRA